MTKKEEIESLSKKFPEWSWGFMGCTPWYITDHIKKHFIKENIDIVRYNRFMINLKPAIHMVPLVDSLFNRTKSNIAMIEAVSVGACCIAESLPEFEKPGVINYTDKNFEYLFEKALKSKKFREESFLQTSEYIKNNLLLSNINQKRLEIIEKVVKK
jgi:hypothetical protein